MMKVLPEQIISYEILTRVPTKSLVRCKSVCKSWNSHYHVHIRMDGENPLGITSDSVLIM
ncbi:hypothetical protein DCAR_0207108 [Daucus carota subsp. sativus]|uniref:F-box domain-containing protein n=1 Tax=Daucus carota subsp. sativus TaxID=79200 RepID=A0AAF0WEG9_DAUCS|nr:hypothetical protein DCAR_0207108 [Daucus carota subsp. sativus]